MIVFVNDVPLRIKKHRGDFPTEKYGWVGRGDEARLRPDEAEGNVLFLDVHKNFIDYIVAELRLGGFEKLKSVTVTTREKKAFKKHLKELFTVIEAAGGLVSNEAGESLLIYRLGRWDLPKGKLEGDESPAVGAVREVEEECGVEVTLGAPICKTWHTYSRNGKRILKCTHWYHMHLLSDEKMTPQVEEGIERVEWKSGKALKRALKGTYPSIKKVVSDAKKKPLKKKTKVCKCLRAL
ncbi:hypothetical protein FUAX_32230 [Fulvitalea axinellae]|uniref:Nudix hydrolase domain-containing protein n=1 Tax=Fulvitalea axinellae TaxID=1182444 RepID=A0AAU9CF74_9BACT|nr:hypothetical protein FUAX_32230 [Fulvitalea axinellae]